MLELGEYAAQEHFNLGKMCVDNKIDYAFFIGDNCEEFKKGMPENSSVFAKDEREKLENAIKEFVKNGKIKTGDAVLVKGSRGMKMEQFYEYLKSII